MGDPPFADVEAIAQMLVLAQRLTIALVGEREHEWQRHVVEGESRRAGNRARHVGDAIMYDVVENVGRRWVRRRARGLGASALVDGDVDDYRAGLHGLDRLGGDQFRRSRARYENRGDHE